MSLTLRQTATRSFRNPTLRELFGDPAKVPENGADGTRVFALLLFLEAVPAVAELLGPSLVRQHALTGQFKGSQGTFESHRHERIAQKLPKALVLVTDVFCVVRVKPVELGEESPDEECGFFHGGWSVEIVAKSGEEEREDAGPTAGVQNGL